MAGKLPRVVRVLATIGALTCVHPGTAGAVVPDSAAAPTSGQAAQYVVTAAPGALGGLAADLARDGVPVVRRFDGLGMAVVRTTAAGATRLGTDPRVAGVATDSRVGLLADSYGTYVPKDDANSMVNITETIGARGMWADRAGRLQWTGRGVDVAVLDSGVTPVPGLTGTGKVVNGPDLSTDSQLPGMRYLDGFGHGTHMAGIIAGRDAGASPAATGDSTSFLGVAPDARVVNVKVADALGGADVSQIIAGIDWVVQHRRSGGLNIRVLNLSLGTPTGQSYVVDPLAHAAEQAWHQGIVVVAAAGNDGTGRGTLLDPALDPYLLAVGAIDTRGTKGTTDDVVPQFSTRGDGRRNPDLVAHGASVQSLRVPGSFIDQQFGSTAVVGGRFMRGSGTSQAAAVTSGAVALVLQRNPSLTPDEVKARLVVAARPLPAANAQAQGHGIVDLRRVSMSRRNSVRPQSFPRSTGSGSLDSARGGYLLADDHGSVLTGERDIFGARFDAAAHARLSAAQRAWSYGRWNGNRWTGYGMAAGGWSAVEWTAPSWTGDAWTARSTGATWTSRTWANGYWSSRTWASRTWASRTWASSQWR